MSYKSLFMLVKIKRYYTHVVVDIVNNILVNKKISYTKPIQFNNCTLTYIHTHIDIHTLIYHYKSGTM